MAPSSAGRPSPDVLLPLLLAALSAAPVRAPAAAAAAPSSAGRVDEAGRGACDAGNLSPEAGLAMLQRAQTRLEAAAAPPPWGPPWEAASEYDGDIDDDAAELLLADAGKTLDDDAAELLLAEADAGAHEDLSGSTTTVTTTAAHISMVDIGATAELNSHGYQLVVNSRNEGEMAKFFGRMVARLGDEVADPTGLSNYAHNATVQGYPCFASVLESIAWAPWVRWGNREDMSHLASTQIISNVKLEGPPKPLVESFVPPGLSKSSAGEQPSEFTDPQKSADHLPLDEHGYSTIAEMRNREAMIIFVRRVAADLGYHIADEGGLTGFVSYFDGEKATQSLKKMREEINLAAWVKTDGISE